MKNLPFLFVLVLTLVSCNIQNNSDLVAEINQVKVQKLDSLLSNFNKQGQFNGNVLISEDGKITFEKSYGFANEIANQNLNRDHVFYLASIAKEFTATAIVMLKERGQLSYQDKITKFIPQLTAYKHISIRNLLNHTSGIGNLDKWLDSLFLKKVNESKELNNADVIKILVQHKPALKSKVSEKFEYSNVGYQLLGSVIENISGLPYATFIRKNMFEPLKMNNSFVYGENISPNAVAVGHHKEDSITPVQIANTLADYQRFKIQEPILGSKGIYSTANDLLMWTNSFSNNNLISKEGFTQMTTQGVLLNNAKTDYGFGLELGFWKDFSQTIGHRGRWPGYTALVEHNPTNKKVVIILQNFDNPSHISQINKIIYNIKPLVFITLSKAATDKFAGEYKSKSGSIRKIVAENDKIYVQMNPQVKLELRPISTHQFVVMGFRPEVSYEFIEKNGVVEKYISRQPERGNLREAVKL